MTLWVVGTGRCGTKSAARELALPHEPPPLLGREAVAAFHNPRSRDALVMQRIEQRMDLAPGVVDHRQSYVVRLIREADPDARFLWLIREPIPCVESMVACGWWNGSTPERWWPRGGWDRYADEVERAAVYWREINAALLEEWARDRDRWEVRVTSTLPRHENERPIGGPAERPPLRREDIARVQGVCGRVWATVLHNTGAAVL